MTLPEPVRSDVWMVDFNPTIGHEQAGVRPGLIVSVDEFNHGASELAVVVPITSKSKNVPMHVPISPPEGGLTMISYIKCEEVRSISRLRLLRHLGIVSTMTIKEVELRLRSLLDL